MSYKYSREMGVATFFLPRYGHSPPGCGCFRGEFSFCGCERGMSSVRTKTQLAHHKTKKWGYTANGKKVD